MMTLYPFAAEPPTLPAWTTWFPTGLAEARRNQKLFNRSRGGNFAPPDQKA